LSLYAKNMASTMAPENEAVLNEQRDVQRSALEPAFANWPLVLVPSPASSYSEKF